MPDCGPGRARMGRRWAYATWKRHLPNVSPTGWNGDPLWRGKNLVLYYPWHGSLLSLRGARVVATHLQRSCDVDSSWHREAQHLVHTVLGSWGSIGSESWTPILLTLPMERYVYRGRLELQGKRATLSWNFPMKTYGHRVSNTDKEEGDKPTGCKGASYTWPQSKMY